MNEQNFSIKGVIQKAKEYFENWKELSGLIVAEKVATIISGLFIGIILFILGLIIIVFLSFSLAFYLGQVISNLPLGFLLVSAIYITIIVVVVASKNSIKNGLINLSIRKIFNNHKEADGNEK